MLHHMAATPDTESVCYDLISLFEENSLMSLPAIF